MQEEISFLVPPLCSTIALRHLYNSSRGKTFLLLGSVIEHPIYRTWTSNGAYIQKYHKYALLKGAVCILFVMVVHIKEKQYLCAFFIRLCWYAPLLKRSLEYAENQEHCYYCTR